MILKYLFPYKEKIKWQELLDLKKERDNWWKRESSKKWIFNSDELPVIDQVTTKYDQNEIILESRIPLSQEQEKKLEDAAKKLIPWRKGPFSFFHLNIDAEWRSDLKWERLKKTLLPLKNKIVLDIGCNNGYFLFRMANDAPKLALGIDPVLQNPGQT